MSSLFKSQCRLVEFSTEQNLVILSSNQNLKKKTSVSLIVEISLRGEGPLK